MDKDIKVLKLQAELFSSVLKTLIVRTIKIHNILFGRKFSGNISVIESVQLL